MILKYILYEDFKLNVPDDFMDDICLALSPHLYLEWSMAGGLQFEPGKVRNHMKSYYEII